MKPPILYVMAEANTNFKITYKRGGFKLAETSDLRLGQQQGLQDGKSKSCYTMILGNAPTSFKISGEPIHTRSPIQEQCH